MDSPGAGKRGVRATMSVLIEPITAHFFILQPPQACKFFKAECAGQVPVYRTTYFFSSSFKYSMQTRASSMPLGVSVSLSTTIGMPI